MAIDSNIKQNTKDLVSVIIRTWNREEDLRRTLTILRAESYEPLEIIVVDNGSLDNTVDMLRDNFPEVELITLPRNTGVAATNIGFKKARGAYFLLLDNDASPEAGVILSAVSKFKDNPKLGIIAFKTIDFPLSYYLENKYKKTRRYKEIKNGIPVKFFCGCGVMIKREVIDEVGGYPEDFFWCGEESDLAMRAIHAGYEIRCYPELYIDHKLSAKNRNQSRRMFYETRNNIWLYWKYSPIILAFLKTAYTIVFNGKKSLGNGTTRYYFKGLSEGIKRLPVVMKQRQVVHTQTIRFYLSAAINNLLKRRLGKYK